MPATNAPAASTLFVVEGACRFSPDNSEGTVVVESTNDQQFNAAIEELQSAAARNLATGYASRQGMGDARVNGIPSYPYPVNAKGVPLDQVVDEHGNQLPPQHPDKQPAAYRANIPVRRAM